jgi:hypothetical protein
MELTQFRCPLFDRGLCVLRRSYAIPTLTFSFGPPNEMGPYPFPMTTPVPEGPSDVGDEGKQTTSAVRSYAAKMILRQWRCF